MDNLNILLKYLVNSDDVTRIAHAAGVEEDVVEKTCVLVFDTLIPTDFTRQEGSHLEKKDLNAITSNFNKLLEGNSLKKIISDVALDKAVEQAKVAVVVKEILVNIRGRLQYMTAAKKNPAPAPKPEPVKEEPKAEPVRVQTRVLEEEQEVTEIKRPVRRSKVEESDETMEETWEKPEEPAKIKRPVRNKPRRVKNGLESEFESDEEELSKGEKIALYVVGALLIAVIVVIVVILLKIKG
ncbi:MAG: hypothetical protein SO189_01910 [Erysipelotrichaceae bacterium]|nr:hypothetical protein [Solobacterium sp.]MDY3793688.1 hypothetical protein [Erysipelotrichaceae bacterium]